MTLAQAYRSMRGWLFPYVRSRDCREKSPASRFSTLNHNLAYCYDDSRVIKFVWTQIVKNRLKGGARSFDE